MGKILPWSEKVSVNYIRAEKGIQASPFFTGCSAPLRMAMSIMPNQEKNYLKSMCLSLSRK